MTKSMIVSDKFIKVSLRLFTLAAMVSFLLPSGEVLACGGGGGSGGGCGSHAQHQTVSGASHEEHATPPVGAAANQESPDMETQRLKSLMNVPILINDPGALLAQADALDLTEEQKAKLQAVQKEAAARAMAVLTDEQKQRLGDVAGRLLTPAQICSSVCPYKQHKTAGSQANEEQTVCPVMEGKINKEVFTEYKGKKVYFCCPACISKFEAKPDDYLAKLPQFQKPETEHRH